MATKNNAQYPIRVVLPPPAPAPSAPRAIGNAIRRAAESAPSSAIDSLPVIGPAIHIARPALAAVPAAFHEFLGGLAGTAADPAPAPAAVVAPAAGVGPQGKYTAAQLAARDNVEKALAQGRTAAPQGAITSYDAQRQFLSTLLGSPLTLQEAAGVMNMAPKAPTPQTDRDKAFGAAGAIYDAQYAQALAAAKKLGAQADIDAANLKATQDYAKNYAGLAGVKPDPVQEAADLQRQLAGG